MHVIERKRKRASQGLAGHALHVHSGDPATLSSGEGRSGRPGGPGSHQSRREGGVGSGGPARREEESHGQRAGSPGVHSGGPGQAAPRVTHGLQPRFVLVSPVSQGKRRACCTHLRVIDSEQTLCRCPAVFHYCPGRGPSGRHLTAHLDVATWYLPLIVWSHSGPACRFKTYSSVTPGELLSLSGPHFSHL